MNTKTFIQIVPPLFTLVAAVAMHRVMPPLLAADNVAPDSALFRAIQTSDINAVKTALQRGANVNSRSHEGDTPLMYAAVYSTPSCMKLLLDRGADPNGRDKRGGTALMRSVHNLEKVRLLINRGADVDAKSDLGIRALMVAANRSGASDVVKLLLARKADAKGPDSQGIAPLQYATELGDLESVKALVTAGADVNAGSSAGPSTMYLAASGPAEVLVWLLEHEGNPNAARRDGRSPLMMAALAGATENVKALLDRGADVNAGYSRGTALIFAAGSDRAGVDMIKLLLDHGADPTVVAKRCDRCIHEPRAEDGSMDLTALMLARQRGETDAVRLLVAAGATR